MSKMKQATLFSLKSWKKVAVEEIQKYKEILDKKGVAEVIILKTLMSLKKKNPSKDSVFSTGIDSSLALLVNHSDPRIASEVKMLIKHWKLESSSPCPNAIEVSKENLPSKTRDFEQDIKIEKVVNKIGKESGNRSVTNPIALNVPKIQTTNKLCPTKVSTKETNVNIHKMPPISEIIEMESVKSLTKMQTPKQICKKESTKQVRKSELTRRLQYAIQIFMEEVGQQEVRLYLEKQA